MKPKLYLFSLFVFLFGILIIGNRLAFASVEGQPMFSGGAPNLVNYQGRVSVDGTPYEGTGYFKFAFVNLAGDITYWSNDGTSSGGSEPTNAVQLPVSGGLFNVLLGDITLTNMSALPASTFAGPVRYLRVWFSTDGSTFTQLPNRRQQQLSEFDLGTFGL